MTVRLTLPYPISANRYWRTIVAKKQGRAITFVSEEAKAYKQECGLIARVSGVREPIDGMVALRVRLIPKNRVCMDLDNCLKVSIDALKGVVYDDDAQVYRINAERCQPDSKGARLEIEIERIDPQAELHIEPQREAVAAADPF